MGALLQASYSCFFYRSCCVISLSFPLRWEVRLRIRLLLTYDYFMKLQPQHYSPSQIGFSAKAATGFGKAIKVSDFNVAVYDFGTASNANATVKVQAANGESAPDFTAAVSATNRWYYVDIAILNNAGAITDGDTGIVWSGTDYNAGVEVNCNGVDYLCLHETANSAGSVTAGLHLYDTGK